MEFIPNQDQEKALKFFTNWWYSQNRFAILEGKPGTGKTALVSALTVSIKDCAPLYTAPTNEACRQLELVLPKDSLIKTTYSALGFNMTTHGEIKELKQGKLPAILNDINLLIVDECFHPDTEVLTRKGFKNITEITFDDEIASMDLESKLTYFDKPLAIIEKEYNGILHYLNSDRITNYKITENHAVVVLREDSLVKTTANRIKSNDKLVLTATLGEQGRKSLTWEEKLAIAFQADGSYDGNGKTSYSNRLINKGYNSELTGICFTFAKTRKIERIKEILDNLSLDYKEIQVDRGRTLIRVRKVPCAWVSKNLTEVFSLYDISQEYCIAFIAELIKWDGSIMKDGEVLYYSSIKEVNIDFAQIIASLAGYKTNKTIQIDARKETFSDVHRLFITNSIYSGNFSNLKHNNLIKEVYKGKVHCVTMPKGTLITRYNGFITVMGNCSFIGETLFNAIQELGIKTLFIGDRLQLPEVKINLRSDDLCEKIVFKQDYPLFTLNKSERSQGELNDFINSLSDIIYKQPRFFSSKYSKHKIQLLTYLQTKQGQQAFLNDEVNLICYSNKEVDTWNREIRQSIFGKFCPEILPKDKIILTAVTNFIGSLDNVPKRNILKNKDKAVCLSTNSKAVVKKVAVANVLGVDCHELQVLIREEKLTLYVPIVKDQLLKLEKQLKIEAISASTQAAKEKRWREYHFISSLFTEAKYSYAITVHRAQGMTIPRVFVNWNDIKKCNNIYLRHTLLSVACSRARDELTIID